MACAVAALCRWKPCHGPPQRRAQLEIAAIGAADDVHLIGAVDQTLGDEFDELVGCHGAQALATAATPVTPARRQLLDGIGLLSADGEPLLGLVRVNLELGGAERI